jgi:shikimate dehydrogenase
MVNGSTRVFVLLGSPVEHSLSPAMQTAAFRALGLNATYVPLKASAEDVAPLIRAVAHAGGGGNVTIPHKAIAATIVKPVSPLVELTGACNTFWGNNGEILGDNTDVPGILASLAKLEAPGTAWLILGTGAAARAAGAAALDRGAAVAVRSRSEEHRKSYEDWARAQGIRLADAGECEVAINATPLGLRPHDPLPLEPGAQPKLVAALDLVYGKETTPWVRAMERTGVRALDGREMLVAQGAVALERWFPREKAPRELMRAVVNARYR